MSLIERIPAGAVAANLAVTDREELFRWVTGRLQAAGQLDGCDNACQRLLDREKIMSTAIHPGVAVPHARCHGARSVVAAVARLAHGLDFGAQDGTPVRLIFALIGPPEATAEHVRVLGQIATIIKQREALDGLLAASSEDEILEVVAAYS